MRDCSYARFPQAWKVHAGRQKLKLDEETRWQIAGEAVEELPAAGRRSEEALQCVYWHQANGLLAFASPAIPRTIQSVADRDGPHEVMVKSKTSTKRRARWPGRWLRQPTRATNSRQV